MATSWTVNGFALIELELSEPVSGAWTASLSCETLEQLKDPVTIRCENGPHEWVGAIVYQSADKARVEAKVVGGANKLGTVVKARGYKMATAASVARDILTDAGERMSATSKPTGSLDFWARFAHQAGDTLATLNATTGDAYRVERDGSVYVGPTAYVAATTDGFVVLRDNVSRRTEYSLLAPNIKPGTIVDGYKAARVDYTVKAASVSAMVVWAEP